MNPRRVLGPLWGEFVRLWGACRGGMGGYTSWPDSGGVGQQSAWVIDGFAMLTNAEAELWPRRG